MELTLLGTAGLAAFLIGGAGVLIVASFRRTIALREALILALKRIERLEAQLALDPNARWAPPPAEAQIEVPTPVAAPVFVPEPIPLEALQAAAQPTRAPPPRVGLAAPTANMAMFASGLAAFAALMAAQIHLISGIIGFGIALLCAALAFSCAEWRRQGDLADERHSVRVWPPEASRIALFSVALALAAIVYARAALDAPPPELAFGLAALLAFASAPLAARYGSWLPGVSIAAAFAAPAFIVGSEWAQTGQAVFVILYLATMATVSHQRAAPLWMWAASAVALYWTAIGIVDPQKPVLWLSACAAFVLIAIAYAWMSAKASAASLRSVLSFSAPEPIISGALLCAASCILFFALLISHAQSVAGPGAALLAIALAAIIASALRPALQIFPAIAALTSIAAIAFWPNNARSVINVADLLSTGAALGLIFSVGAGASLFRPEARASSAYIAALAPIGLVAALHLRLDSFGGSLWAGAGLALALLNALAYVQFAKPKPHLATPFGAGAALSIAAALYVAAPERFGGFALALALPLFAVAETWRAERGLRIAAVLVAPLAALALMAPEIAAPASSTPVLIAFSFGASAFAAWAGARLFETGPARAKSAAAQTALTLCLFLIGAMASLIARHLFTAGAIGAPFDDLGELAAHILIWLGLAVLMAQRFPKAGRRILVALEALALGVSLTLALVAGLVLINPWWGLAPAPASSWIGLSVILPAYAAPALILLLYGHLRSRNGMETRAGVARAVGLTLLFTAIILELRRNYHGAHMADAPILPIEAWTYNAAALGLAALMFALSAERPGRLLRYASLALALLTLGKAALFDLGGLSGPLHLAAFVGLVGAGGGLIWFYRRFVLPTDAAQIKTVDAVKPDLPKPDLIKSEPTKTLAETSLSPPG